MSALTVTVTVSTEVLVPSLTSTWKVNVELLRPSGAVKVGCPALASLRVTAGPSVCVQV